MVSRAWCQGLLEGREVAPEVRVLEGRDSAEEAGEDSAAVAEDAAGSAARADLGAIDPMATAGWWVIERTAVANAFAGTWRSNGTGRRPTRSRSR